MATENPQALPARTFGPPPTPVERAIPHLLPTVMFGAASLGLVIYVQVGNPVFAVQVVLAPLVALVCVVRPALAVFAALFFTGTIGTLFAFTAIPVIPSIHFVLVVLWLSLAWVFLTGRAERTLRLWPALIPLGLYIAVTLLEVPLTTPVDLGFEDFKAATWYMAAVLLLAAAPWSEATHARIARGIAFLAFAVGLYCVYRWQFGLSSEEYAVAQATQPNVTPIRFNGSFTHAGELAQWGGALIPFCTAMALFWQGRWRWIAIVAVGALTIAVFASHVRTGIAVAAFGTAVTCSLFILSQAFRARRATALVLTLSLVAIVGAGGYAVTLQGDPAQADRFSKILTPSKDLAFSERQRSWEDAWRIIEQNPWGHGLGTAGSVGRNENPRGVVGPVYLDSSYLTIALEQGLALMALYIVSLFVLLAGLALSAIRTLDRQGAALMIGASGVLAANILLFYTGHFNEGPVVLASWIAVGLGVAQATVGRRRSGRAPLRPS